MGRTRCFFVGVLFFLTLCIIPLNTYAQSSIDKGEAYTSSNISVLSQLMYSVPLPFTDVKEDNPYFEAIYALWKHDVIHGFDDGTFHSDKSISRAELLKIIIESHNGLTKDEKNQMILESDNNFYDISTDDWFYPYVEIAFEKVWVRGYFEEGVTLFKPNDPVSKVEALKMLLESNNVEFAEMSMESQFIDINLNDWYAKYVLFAQNNHLLADTGFHFYPHNEAKRGWTSEVIYRLNKDSFVIEESSPEEPEEESQQEVEEELSTPFTPTAYRFTRSDLQEPVSYELYPFISQNFHECPIRAIINPEETALVWNANGIDYSTLFFSDPEGKNIRKIIELKSGLYIENPSHFIPYRFTQDQKSVYVYKTQCNNDAYKIFNYFADELYKITIDTGDIEKIATLSTSRSIDGKFLDISLDETWLAYFYSESFSGFEPFKTWMRIKNTHTGGEKSYRLPEFVSKDQQFGEGYFSPDNSKIAYMMSAGLSPDEDIYSIIILDVHSGESRKIIESDANWSGEWLLTGFKDNATIILKKTEYIDKEPIETIEEISF